MYVIIHFSTQSYQESVPKYYTQTNYGTVCCPGYGGDYCEGLKCLTLYLTTSYSYL